MASTGVVYSGVVIPTKSFIAGIKHVEPVPGYYIFFTANLFDNDLKEQLDSENLNTIAVCCLYNVGCMAFDSKYKAEEVFKKLSYLKGITMDEWYRPYVSVLK